MRFRPEEFCDENSLAWEIQDQGNQAAMTDIPDENLPLPKEDMLHKRLHTVCRHLPTDLAIWPAHQNGARWFGFSAFYAGLQLADFAAYLIDFVSNERDAGTHGSELYETFSRFREQIQLVRIP